MQDGQKNLTELEAFSEEKWAQTQEQEVKDLAG